MTPFLYKLLHNLEATKLLFMRGQWEYTGFLWPGAQLNYLVTS
jgi:hypothetical protein